MWKHILKAIIVKQSPQFLGKETCEIQAKAGACHLTTTGRSFTEFLHQHGQMLENDPCQSLILCYPGTAIAVVK